MWHHPAIKLEYTYCKNIIGVKKSVRSNMV